MKPLLTTLAALLACCPLLGAEIEKQYYEVRSYVLGDSGDAAAIDDYLERALLPALDRQGVGPVGVFTNAENDGSRNPPVIVVVIPYDSVDAISTINSQVEADQQYQADAQDYLARGPRAAPYQRIESELLVAMQCWPRLQVPERALDNQDRVYELRVYESANERLGHLKVEMFDAGEVPIFLDCHIIPVFIGRAVVGRYTPNLTYLTMYENEEARKQGWQQFLQHPDWKRLSGIEKYKGTVSKIHKYILVPKPYSNM